MFSQIKSLFTNNAPPLLATLTQEQKQMAEQRYARNLRDACFDYKHPDTDEDRKNALKNIRLCARLLVLLRAKTYPPEAGLITLEDVQINDEDIRPELIRFFANICLNFAKTALIERRELIRFTEWLEIAAKLLATYFDHDASVIVEAFLEQIDQFRNDMVKENREEKPTRRSDVEKKLKTIKSETEKLSFLNSAFRKAEEFALIGKREKAKLIFERGGLFQSKGELKQEEDREDKVEIIEDYYNQPS